MHAIHAASASTIVVVAARTIVSENLIEANAVVVAVEIGVSTAGVGVAIGVGAVATVNS